MNGVCTNIIHLENKVLKYYGGNYDAFVKTRLELLENQAKQYQWEQVRGFMRPAFLFTRAFPFGIEVQNVKGIKANIWSMLLPSSFFLQDQIAHMKNYIARFGHGSAKLARQAQSKEKTLAKMVAGGLTEKVKADRDVSFYFYSCGEIPPPVIMVQVRFT